MPDQDKKNQLEEPTLCKKCGQPFHCSRSPRCWCYEVDIPVERLEALHREFEACICPTCLQSYAG